MLTLFWGFISGIIVALPLTTLLNEPDILVGFVEEPAKAVAVTFLALKYPTSISTKSRGLILGGLAGLGFSALENLWYFLGGAGSSVGSSDILVRTIMDVPVHIMFSGIVGLGLVYLAQKQLSVRNIKPNQAANVLVADFSSRDVISFFLLAMILHGVFDVAVDYFMIGPFPLVFFVVIFIYYRLWKTLPENLGTFKFPGFLGLLGAIVGVRKLTTATPALAAQKASQPLTSLPADVKFCTNCGKKIPIAAKFCNGCGTSQ